MNINFFEIIERQFQIKTPEADLYQILPRFVDEGFVYEYVKGLLHKPIERAFEWREESCQLIIAPASVEDDDGQHRHYFPGRQEKQVETALIALAAQNENVFLAKEKKLIFTADQLEKQLSAAGIQLSRKQIKRSLEILSGVNLTICKQEQRMMFQLIEALLIIEKKADVQFSAIAGDLLVAEIERHKPNPPE